MARAMLVAALMLAAGLIGRDAFAFRMIQNTGVGRFSAGAAVPCDAAGGFTHWTTSNISFRHNTASQGAGKGTALANAATSWTNVNGANHSVSIAGTTNAGFVTDGTNTLLWATGNGCSGGCLAITALVLSSGQVITETDVSFNNVATWATNGSNYDTEAVAAHEIGHCLGVHHTNLNGGGNNKRPTMYAAYFGTGGRSLASDDNQALQCAQNRYPISEAQGVVTGVMPMGAWPGRTVTLAARPRTGGAILRFALAEGGDVRLQLFDVAGRQLTTLVNGYQGAGEHEVAWDGGTGSGKVPSGVYFARITTPGEQARATVILAE
jgi:hypothetical protein